MADDYKEVFWKGVRQIQAPTYEACAFRPIPNTEPPDFEFEVRLENEQTRELISNVLVKLSADDELWAYIQDHPLWQKDPRLLFLMNVYDIFWKIKIIPVDINQPFETQIVVQPLQGGTMTLAVSAQLRVDVGGVHVISVVNYANTHVQDQVKAVIQDNPDAQPSDVYIKSVKGRFLNDNIDAKRLKKKEQRRRLKVLKRVTIKHERRKVFIDESGDVGFRSLREPYILSALILPSSEYSAVAQDLSKILRTHWQTPPQELHFNKVPASKRELVQKDIARCLLDHEGICISVIGHKPGFLGYLLRCEAEFRKTEEQPITTNWAFFLDKAPTGLARATLILMLEELLFHIGTETVDIQTPLEIIHDMKHRTWMNEALKTAFQRSQKATSLYSKELFGEELRSARGFKLVESINEPCLWIPDWISWELATWYKGGVWSQSFESCFKKIFFITFDHVYGKLIIDQPGGKIVSTFADTPREIVAI